MDLPHFQWPIIWGRLDWAVRVWRGSLSSYIWERNRSPQTRKENEFKDVCGQILSTNARYCLDRPLCLERPRLSQTGSIHTNPWVFPLPSPWPFCSPLCLLLFQTKEHKGPYIPLGSLTQAWQGCVFSINWEPAPHPSGPHPFLLCFLSILSRVLAWLQLPGSFQGPHGHLPRYVKTSVGLSRCLFPPILMRSLQQTVL